MTLLRLLASGFSVERDPRLRSLFDKLAEAMEAIETKAAPVAQAADSDIVRDDRLRVIDANLNLRRLRGDEIALGQRHLIRRRAGDAK